MRIRKNDTVLMIAGDDKGKTGRVLWVDTVKNRVLVEGINKVKKHQRPTQKNPKGGIVSIEKPVHMSNVSLFVNVDGKTKATRIIKKVVVEDGRKTRVRIAKVTGDQI